MAATKTQKPKAHPEPMFEDDVSFEVFLEDVEESLRGVGVTPENTRLILKVLTKKFGQGLPKREP